MDFLSFVSKEKLVGKRLMVHSSWSRKWINGLFCKEVSLSKEAFFCSGCSVACLFWGWDLEKPDFCRFFWWGIPISSQ